MLVTRGSLVDFDLLLEYTPAGALVQALPLPGSFDFTQGVAKDLVLDSRAASRSFASRLRELR